MQFKIKQQSRDYVIIEFPSIDHESDEIKIDTAQELKDLHGLIPVFSSDYFAPSESESAFARLLKSMFGDPKAKWVTVMLCRRVE